MKINTLPGINSPGQPIRPLLFTIRVLSLSDQFANYYEEADFIVNNFFILPPFKCTEKNKAAY